MAKRSKNWAGAVQVTWFSTKLFWGLNEGINEKDTLNRKYLLEALKVH